MVGTGFGLPTPSRRTLASGIHALRSLDGGYALGILPSLAANAVSRGWAARSLPVLKSTEGGGGLPVPQEPAYAAERSQDGEAKAASERAKNRMFVASVR
jgi:hypothetical protein